MVIYEYTDYKLFLQNLIKSMPRKGHGQAKRLSEHLAVNSVVISQILSGDRHFTPEQALQVSAFFGFDERATDYLVHLVNKDRAGTVELKNYYGNILKKMSHEQLDLKNRIAVFKELSDEDKSIYYSNWYYAAIRLTITLPDHNTIDAIASYLKLSRAKVAEVITFLKNRGLVTEEDGKLNLTTRSIYLDPQSPYINNHRRNWRQKAVEKFTEPGPNDTFSSFVYGLSVEDIQHIRKEIADMIARASKRVRESPQAKLACLNIDWFEL